MTSWSALVFLLAVLLMVLGSLYAADWDRTITVPRGSRIAYGLSMAACGLAMFVFAVNQPQAPGSPPSGSASAATVDAGVC